MCAYVLFSNIVILAASIVILERFVSLSFIVLVFYSFGCSKVERPVDIRMQMRCFFCSFYFIFLKFLNSLFYCF
jgi:hypothetical protein